MSTQVKMTTIPDCDICKQGGKSVKAYADAKLDFGPWANVCKMHFRVHKCSLGTGRGQELILRDPDVSEDQTQRIKDNLKGVDLEKISFADLDELFEDRDPMEFM